MTGSAGAVEPTGPARTADSVASEGSFVVTRIEATVPTTIYFGSGVMWTVFHVDADTKLGLSTGANGE